MNLTINPKVDISDTQTLRFGGVEFRVARLMFRQTSRIEPKLPDVLAILNRRSGALANPPKPDASEAEANAFMRMMALSEAESDLLLGIIHIGLSRVYLQLTFDDLADLPLRAPDLFEAVTAILGASSLVEKKAPNAGEAPAANR
jgi:hypothetical protein